MTSGNLQLSATPNYPLLITRTNVVQVDCLLREVVGKDITNEILHVILIVVHLADCAVRLYLDDSGILYVTHRRDGSQ